MHRQQGFSFFSLAFLLALIAGVISLALKIIPPYMDFLTFSGATLETMKQPRIGLQSNDAIVDRVDKQLSINNLHLRNFGEEALTMTRLDGVLTAEIDYTKVEPVFESEDFQIALSLHFSKVHEVNLNTD
ncbi:MAG: DUF4845 domain-containing protein [Pseudomonadota bacterium]